MTQAVSPHPHPAAAHGYQDCEVTERVLIHRQRAPVLSKLLQQSALTTTAEREQQLLPLVGAERRLFGLVDWP